MKTCRGCGIDKPLSEFYRHKDMRDGHLNHCKDCKREDSRIHYANNRQRYANYERKRNKDPKRIAQRTASQRRRRARNPEKTRARRMVRNAIRTGRLSRQPCERCGATEEIHAHHHDYNQPLDVEWLCRHCHDEEHGRVTIS